MRRHKPCRGYLYMPARTMLMIIGMRFFILLPMLFFCAAGSAREVTITGNIVTSDGNPSVNAVLSFQTGSPYFSVTPGVDWTLLARSVSTSDGMFALTLNTVDSDNISLVIPYEYPRYSLLRNIDVTNKSVISNVRFEIPGPIQESKKQLSVQFKIFENNSEIFYSRRIYTIVMVTSASSGDGLFMELNTSSYSVFKNRLNNLPDGKYKVLCFLASKDSVGTDMRKDFELTLPLTDKIVPISFGSTIP